MAFLPMFVKNVLQRDYCENQIPIEEVHSSNATEGIKSPDKKYVPRPSSITDNTKFLQKKSTQAML